MCTPACMQCVSKFTEHLYLGRNGTNDKKDKGGKNFIREVGGEKKKHKGGGRCTPCVPPGHR